MEGIDPQFLVYVAILAIVAISTLVKKAIEKAAAKPEDAKKQISLRDAVREQLRRYMETNEAPGGPPFPPGFPRPTLPPETASPPLARPARPALDEVKGEETPPPEPPPLPPADDDRGHAPLPPAPSPSRARMRSGGELRRAIVLAEILGPPVAERESERLF